MKRKETYVKVFENCIQLVLNFPQLRDYSLSFLSILSLGDPKVQLFF